MEITLDNRISLYEQVKSAIITQIRSGEMPPKSKIPSERDLARRFRISRGTAKQALQELEAENYIERIPARGSFVRDNATAVVRPFNIIFPFPEPEISMDALDYASYAADTEVYRGIMSGCGANNARVTFQHIPETVSKSLLQTQVREIREFDGAVFLGNSQLQGLKSELRKYGIPFVTIYGGEELGVQGNTVVYNRSDILAQSAAFIVDSGCKSVGMIINKAPDRSKENILASVFEERGIEFDSDWIFHIDSKESKAYSELARKLPDDLDALPDLFFCASPVYSFALLKIANECGWRIPNDLGVFGYANNMDLRPTEPILTHVRLPYFEMGAEACRVLAEGRRGEFVVPAQLIEGESVGKF